jgi:hypothetical protein
MFRLPRHALCRNFHGKGAVFRSAAAHVQGLGQNVALTRLGPNTVVAACPRVLSYNWFLDCSNPEHNDVTHLLVKQALADETQNWFNLKLSGSKPVALTCLNCCIS